MEKKDYFLPKIQIVELEDKDLIATSGGETEIGGESNSWDARQRSHIWDDYE